MKGRSRERSANYRNKALETKYHYIENPCDAGGRTGLFGTKLAGRSFSLATVLNGWARDGNETKRNDRSDC